MDETSNIQPSLIKAAVVSSSSSSSSSSTAITSNSTSSSVSPSCVCPCHSHNDANNEDRERGNRVVECEKHRNNSQQHQQDSSEKLNPYQQSQPHKTSILVRPDRTSTGNSGGPLMTIIPTSTCGGVGGVGGAVSLAQRKNSSSSRGGYVSGGMQSKTSTMVTHKNSRRQPKIIIDGSSTLPTKRESIRMLIENKAVSENKQKSALEMHLNTLLCSRKTINPPTTSANTLATTTRLNT